MKIEITGSRCITCQKYTQYYQNHYERGFEAIDHGYCWKWYRTVRPGDRCRAYAEGSNVSVCEKVGQELVKQIVQIKGEEGNHGNQRM